MDLGSSKLYQFQWIRKHKYIILVIVMLLVWCIAPLCAMATTRGDDIGFHMQRIQALAEELKRGNVFPRIYTTMLAGNGYATPLFYGDLFFHIPAVLVVCGVSLTDAYAVFVAMIFVAVTLSMYFCIVSMTQNTKAAFCGAVMYGLSPYLLTDLIQRAAIGEALAFIFIPVTFLGFYHIMYGKLSKWYLLPLGLAGMLNCHLLSSVATVIILAGFFVAAYKQYVSKPVRLVYVAISAAVFFLLSANFIFPMLEQMLSGSFLATDGFSAKIHGTLKRRTMPWWALFYDHALVKDAPWSPQGVGTACVVFWGIYFCGDKKFRSKTVTFLIIASAGILFMITDRFPWDYFQKVAGILQFPWRLLVYPTFFTAVSVALYFTQSGVSKNHGNLMYVIMALSLSSYVCAGAEHFNTYRDYQVNHVALDYAYYNAIGAGEYLPSDDQLAEIAGEDYIYVYVQALTDNANTVYSDGNPETSLTRDGDRLVVTFSGMDKDDAYLDVPLLMYKGYHARMDDGSVLDCEFGTNNRVRVYVGDAREGTVIFEYAGTRIQKISAFITILSVTAMAGYLFAVPVISKKKRTG